MNLIRISHIAMTCCLLTSVALAQVPTETIKPGTLLSASGIQLTNFGKPLPLPPGNWEVLYRADTALALTGGGRDSAPVVSLTLRNTDGAATLAAMVLVYTPDVIQIHWKGNTACKEGKAPFMEDFGTTTGSLNYACAMAFVNEKGFKSLVSTASTHPNAWVKEFLAPLASHQADLPDRVIWSTLNANRDRSRSLYLTFFSRPAVTSTTGEPLDGATRNWLTATGKAYIDFLEGQASVVQPYPRLEAAVTQ